MQIVTEDASFDLFQNLSKLEKQYGETLTRCHRNCLVNLERVKSMELQTKTLFLEKKVNMLFSYARRRYRANSPKMVERRRVEDENICFRR